MDINLPLILLIAVSFTGLAWLFDVIFLRKNRLAAMADVDGQFEDKSHSGYKSAMTAASAEPAVIEYSKSFFPVLALVFVLRSFVIEPFQIPSESMVPTLEVGDFIVVNKFIYGIRLPVFRNKVINITDPKRGDVMVFFPPKKKQYYIKRVVGLPGDKIRIENNVLFINGEEMAQSNVTRDPTQYLDWCTGSAASYQVADEMLGDKLHKIRKCSLAGPYGRQGYWEIPEGEYLMVGDNRDNSSDSRDWGLVPEERIVGKAFAIWMHWETFFSLPTFSRIGSI